MELVKYAGMTWARGWMLALALVMIGGGAVSASESEDITIAAASDLNFAIKDLIVEYEKQSGHHVKLSLGSSGNFYAQLQQGAPFDLYLSADIGYPKKLEEAGLVSICCRAGRLMGAENFLAGCGQRTDPASGPCDSKNSHCQPQACALWSGGSSGDGT